MIASVIMPMSSLLLAGMAPSFKMLWRIAGTSGQGPGKVVHAV